MDLVEAVELNPVNPILISAGDIDPTLEVALTPVTATIGEDVIAIEPTLEVALNPVKS